MTTEKTKVLYLITKSNWGGAQKYVFDLTTNLPKDHYEVVAAFGGTGEKNSQTGLLAQKLSEASILTKTIKSFTRDIFFLNEPLAFLEVGKIIWQSKPDVLHLNSSKAAGIGSFMGRLLRVPKIIYTVHGWPFNEHHPTPIKLALYFFSWLTAVFAHQVIVINQTDLAQGKAMWFVGRKMNLIYNGLAPIPFLTKTEARTKLGQILNTTFTDNELILGTIAELHPNKNLNILIEAVAQNPNWKLIVIGEGQDRKNLEALINKLNLSGRVFLTGFVEGGSTHLKAFNAFALVSKKEGLPYVILEAGLAELLVIGSNIPGITEIIKDNCGLITETNNSNSIAEALLQIENKQDLANQLATNLHQKVQSEFSLEKMMEETLKLY